MLKWKLGLVGVIASIGLGLAGARPATHADLVLCAIPLVCVYVDLLCRHLSLRILVIGVYFRHAKTSDVKTTQEYEDVVELSRGGKTDPDPFALEDWATSYSTLALSTGLLAYGVGLAIDKNANAAIVATFILTALAGVAVTFWARAKYETRRDWLKGDKLQEKVAEKLG